MTATETTPELRKTWGWFFALGIVMIIGGLLALFAPFMASLVVEAMVGAAFLVGGIISLVQVFQSKDGWRARTTYLILGLFNVLAGLVLLLRPLEGLLALTLVLAVAILLNGVLRGVIGFQSKPAKGWGWIVASGGLSVLVALFIFSQFPEISVVLLGIFAAVALIGDGAGFIRFAYGLKTGDDISVARP